VKTTLHFITFLAACFLAAQAQAIQISTIGQYGSYSTVITGIRSTTSNLTLNAFSTTQLMSQSNSAQLAAYGFGTHPGFLGTLHNAGRVFAWYGSGGPKTGGNTCQGTTSCPPTSVPEPPTVALLGLGLLLIVVRLHRRTTAAAPRHS